MVPSPELLKFKLKVHESIVFLIIFLEKIAIKRIRKQSMCIEWKQLNHAMEVMLEMISSCLDFITLLKMSI